MKKLFDLTGKVSIVTRGNGGIGRAIAKGLAHQGADIVLADTAGRLHTKTELMDEIQKVKRAAGKARTGAPDEVWLVAGQPTMSSAMSRVG